MQRIILFFVLLAVLVAAGVVWLKNSTEDKADRYATTVLIEQTIVQQQYISGTISSMNEVEIVPHISGIIEKLFVETGQSVKYGQPMAKIQLIAAPANKESANAAMSLAMLKYDLANKEYIRAKEAYDQQIIAKSEFDVVESNWMQAREELQTARKQLEIAQKGYVPDEHGLSDIITATITGTIVDISAKEGSSVIERNNFNSGTIIATIADMDKLVFKGRVSEKDIGHLRQGMVFTVRIPALNNAVYTANLSYIGTKGVDDNGIVRFDIEGRIVTDGTNPSLARTGYSGVAEIQVAEAKNALTVEEKNIIYQNDSTYVEIVEQHRKQLQPITLGICDGIYCEIKGGLSKEHKIVIQD